MARANKHQADIWVRVHREGYSTEPVKVLAESAQEYTLLIDGKSVKLFKAFCTPDARMCACARQEKQERAQLIGLDRRPR